MLFTGRSACACRCGPKAALTLPRPMGSISLQEQRVRRVGEAFASLPGRYLGAEPGFDATVQIRLGDVGRTWEVRTRGERCQVRPSPVRDPDVVIGTDSGTWLALREGRLSGLDAFAQRRLYAHGDLDLALGFEGLFRLPGGRPPLLQVTDAGYFARATLGYMDAMEIERAHLVGNSMGGRVALELALSEPDRVASLSLLSPALAFLRRRELVPLVKLLRPELAAIPHPLRTARVREYFWSLFAHPDRLDPVAADIAADEF